ncbi:oligosaccharide flippase family protein [Candidatus Microgenomates bacterium]|nr:oligosaccharide flippase family protein [Candidatus Microgenomates bacterium]
MKTAFIIVTVAGMEDMTRKLVLQVKAWRVRNLSVYVIRNERGKEGYASGVNKGIQEAIKDDAELFIVANPDISLKGIHPKQFFEAAAKFDVWGYAFKQEKQVYYGGQIDSIRLSGGLKKSIPSERFAQCDFVSGSLCGFHKAVIDTIGLWDEGYGMYYEDVDFCLRARRAGLRVGIDSETEYIHYETSGESTLKKEQLATNRFRFFLKYADIKQTSYEAMRLPLTIFEYRKLIWDSIKTRPFLVNFLSLNTSSLFLKILNFILFLFLVRLLSVPEYGVYTLIWALVGFLTPLADFGTTSFGITQLADSRVSFNELFSFRFFVAIIVGIVSLITAVLFNVTAGAGLFLIASVMLANNFSGSLLVLMSNKSKTYVTSLIAVAFNSVLIIATIATLIMTHDLTHALFTIGAAYLLYSVINLYYLKKFYVPLALIFSTAEWRNIANYSFVFLLLGFFAGVYFRIDVLLLNKLKGNEAVGIYSAGYKFFEALLFVASSYTIAAAPIIQKLILINRDECMKRIKRDSRLLFSFGMGSAIVLSILAPAVLPILLKHSYAHSVQVFQIVIFALPFMLVSTVYMSVLFILKKSKAILALFAAQALLVFLLNIIYIPRYSYYASAVFTVLAEVVNVIAVMILVHKTYADLT